MEQIEIDKVVESYKSKGAKVDKIEIVISDKDVAVAYLIKPNRLVLSPIIACIATDPIRAAEIWLESCLIKEISDSRFTTDDMVVLSAMAHLDGLVSLKKSTLTSV